MTLDVSMPNAVPEAIEYVAVLGRAADIRGWEQNLDVGARGKQI